MTKDTYYQQISTKINPTISGWYDTDKGNLYWFGSETLWSCRDDRPSEERPDFWYKPVSLLVVEKTTAMGVDDKTKIEDTIQLILNAYILEDDMSSNKAINQIYDLFSPFLSPLTSLSEKGEDEHKQNLKCKQCGVQKEYYYQMAHSQGVRVCCDCKNGNSESDKKAFDRDMNLR